MLDRSPDGRGSDGAGDAQTALPPPEVAEFIRYCHRRRRSAWPEIYDDMCAIAARREFKGWDHARLAEAGVSFTLFDTPRLSAWVRALIPPEGASSLSESSGSVAVGPGIPDAASVQETVVGSAAVRRASHGR